MNNKYLPLMCGTEFLAQLLIKNIKQTKVNLKNFNIIMHWYDWKIAPKDLPAHHIKKFFNMKKEVDLTIHKL